MSYSNPQVEGEMARAQAQLAQRQLQARRLPDLPQAKSQTVNIAGDLLPHSTRVPNIDTDEACERTILWEAHGAKFRKITRCSIKKYFAEIWKSPRYKRSYSKRLVELSCGGMSKTRCESRI